MIFGIFWNFDADALAEDPKNFKSRRTKIVCNEYTHLFYTGQALFCISPKTTDPIPHHQEVFLDVKSVASRY
jgi:hypothetical protein